MYVHAFCRHLVIDKCVVGKLCNDSVGPVKQNQDNLSQGCRDVLYLFNEWCVSYFVGNVKYN